MSEIEEIRARLSACDALRNLPQDEIGTRRHRMLDDTAYDSTTERQVRALLDAYDAAQAHNKALQHDLDWCKREKTEALETLTSWQDIEPQLDEAKQRIEALETALQSIAKSASFKADPARAHSCHISYDELLASFGYLAEDARRALDSDFSSGRHELRAVCEFAEDGNTIAEALARLALAAKKGTSSE